MGSLKERCCAGLEDATEKRMQEDEIRKRRKAAELSSKVSSLVPRLSCVGGEKRAWYALFAHAQFSQDFWEFGNFP